VMSAKRALVTGGTAGLGRALCDQLVAQGYTVVSADLKAPSRDCGFEHIACDLAQRHSVDFLAEQLAKREPFDLVIFNAGISATGRFEDIAPEAHVRVLAVNADAPLTLCAAFLKNNTIKRGGHIGFVSSLSHFTGYPGAASYAAAKDTLAVYAKSVRKPFAKTRNISVTCAYPGPLKTEHAARHAPKDAKAEKRLEPAQAARFILADTLAGKARSFPGTGTALFALSGRAAPGLLTQAMRKIIYDKLDRKVED
ncbi:MAG: SDR family NAD(P)-dependent oxidoreductase, partial [Ahrensia sp.]